MASSRSEENPIRAAEALDEIAMRKNLLALCAALGAASAAEDDKRFAMVAAALRELADTIQTKDPADAQPLSG